MNLDLPFSTNNAALLCLLLMPPLLSTDTVYALPRPDQWILTCRNTFDTTKIRRWAEGNLLLLRHIIISYLVKDQFANWYPNCALVWHCRVVKYIVIVGNMGLNSKDNGLLREALMEVFFKVALVQLLKLCWIAGVQMITICGVKTVADVGDLVLCVGQDVRVGLIVGDVAVCERVWFGRLDKCSR